MTNEKIKELASDLKKVMNSIIQSQNCDIASKITEEMRKYPKDSTEYKQLKILKYKYAFRIGTYNAEITRY